MLSNIVHTNVEIDSIDSTFFNVGNFKIDIHNVVSTLIWHCPTSRCHIILTTKLRQRWNVFWVLTSITSNIDFWKMSKLLCSRFFHIFRNVPLKYSSLYTRLQIILKRLYWKVNQQNFFSRKGYLWNSCNKSI